MSQDTMSSGHNLDDSSNGVNSSSTLTFSKNNQLLNFMASHGTLFAPATHSNQRPNLFVGQSFERSNNRSTSTISTTLNSTRTHHLQSKPIVQHHPNHNDPLSHIYETISVSSSSNIPNTVSRSNSNNNYNIFNHYNLHQTSSQISNAYNDLDSEFEHALPVNTVYNDLSISDSSSSQKSNDYFLHNSKQNQAYKKNSKCYTRGIVHNWIPPKFQSQQQQPINRFSELNISPANKSSSPTSSTSTTTTDLVSNKHNALIFNPSQSLISTSDLNAIILQQQNLNSFNARNKFKNSLSNTSQYLNDFEPNNRHYPAPNGSLNFLSNHVEAVV